MAVTPRRIEVQIDELILHGVSRAHALGVAEAAKRELARLFAERGIADGLIDGAAIDVLDCGERRTAATTPGTLGREIAGAIGGGICR